MKRLLLTIGLITTLAGCSKTEAPAPAAAEPTASSTAAPEAAVAQAPASEAPDTAAPAVDTGPAKPIPARWAVDRNYEIVSPAQATNTDAGQVEVIEFLWLGCPHCYEMNPYIEAWKKKKPAYVAFRQEHVTWNAQRMHARLFYTLRAMGAGDDIIVKAFDEIHRKGNFLMANRPAETEQMQLEFVVANGLDGQKFQREYEGFAVNTSINRADELVRRYLIDSVPTFVVNGKYRTDVSMAGGPEQLIQLIGDLVESEKGN
jgi:thiol:disulfide interchange protein DsbA